MYRAQQVESFVCESLIGRLPLPQNIKKMVFVEDDDVDEDGPGGLVERGKEECVWGTTGGEAAADYSSSPVGTPMQHQCNTSTMQPTPMQH